MITSLDKDTSPEQLLRINRMHWSCENNHHWVKDCVFREDHSTTSAENGPAVLSLLRSLAIAVIATVSDKITATREMFSRDEWSLLPAFEALVSDF